MDVALIRCATCGSQIPPDATTCVACGNAPLATALTAPHAADLAARPLLNGLLPDVLLKGRYRLVALSSQRGRAVMYQAEDTELGNRLVAVKGFSQRDPSPDELAEAIKQLQQEASLLAGLRHPNLPHLYDFFQEAGYPFLVLDFIDGTSLETYLQHIPGSQVPVEEVLQIGLQLATVLEYLHTRQPPLLFGDLRPATILRTPTGSLYLTDFRAAYHLTAGRIADALARGSPGYAAPEHGGAGQPDGRSDIYSLGATLYHLLTGRVPASHPPVMWKGVPGQVTALPGLKTLLEQMVKQRMDDRPASMVEVKQRLYMLAEELAARQWGSGVGEGLGILPGGRPTHTRAGRPISRRVVLMGLAGVALVGGTATTLALARNIPTLLTLPGISPDLLTYRGHTGLVHSVAWSPNGQRIASGSDDFTVQVWNAADGGDVFTYRGHAASVNAVSWSPDGRYIASGSDDETVQVWEVVTGKTLVTYRGHAASVKSVTWSPDGIHIASCDYFTIQVWKVSDGSPVYSQMSAHQNVDSVAWSPDGRRIAASGGGWNLQVWDAIDRSNLVKYSLEGWVLSPTWSPDSTRIAVGKGAVGNGGGTVQIWDDSTGSLVFIYRGHTSDVDVVAWSPGGTRIASGGSDQTVQVWNASDGGQVFTYRGHTADVDALAWSPNDTYIASGSYDTTIQIWKPG